MSYQATVLQLLISCPGDVQSEDLAAVRRAITRWNVLQGEGFEHVVVPVSWSEHVAAEFGGAPQEIVNSQLVEVADLAIAIFWNKLGTPTQKAESGTAEEVLTLHEAGKPVSVLRCSKPVPPSGDHDERARLDDYLDREIRTQGLTVDYDTAEGLERQVDTILTRMVRKHEQKHGPASAQGDRRGRAHILPQTKRERYTKYSSKGQPKTETDYQLIFTNDGGTEAHDIQWHLESSGGEGELPSILNSDVHGTSIPCLASGAQVEYKIMMLMGSVVEFLCHVSWRDGDHTRQTTTTLRT